MILRNIGDANLQITSASISEYIAFRLTSAPHITLQPGASVTISVAFHPESFTQLASVLSISTTDPKLSHISVNLSGYGIQSNPTVIDGTFETAWLSPPWQTYQPASGFVAQVLAGSGRGGRYGLVTSGGTGLVYQDIVGLVYGMRYNLTAWVKITPGATAIAFISVHDTM